MGTWDATSFGNDTAVDWTYGLEDDGLQHIESALDATQSDEELEASVGEEAVAAAEVVARMRGKPGVVDSYSQTVDDWVKARGKPPAPALVRKAVAALDRVTQPPSELLGLWQESDEGAWTDAIDDLRERLGR
jgi:hypothetical protein